jgi:predicted ferric reductase
VNVAQMARLDKATVPLATAIFVCIWKNIFQLLYPFKCARVQSRRDPLFLLSLFHLSPAMGNLLYIIAVVLVIIWAISYFGGFYTGGIIHTLLVIAIIAILLRVISGRSAV